MDAKAEHDAGSSKDALCAVTNLDSSKVQKKKKKEKRYWATEKQGGFLRLSVLVVHPAAFPEFPLTANATCLHNNYTSLRWSWNYVNKSTQQLTTKCFFRQEAGVLSFAQLKQSWNNTPSPLLCQEAPPWKPRGWLLEKCLIQTQNGIRSWQTAQNKNSPVMGVLSG